MSIVTDRSSAVEPRCRTVFGYVLGFEGRQRKVIGVERYGQWYLPGGTVEGDDLPDTRGIPIPPDCCDPPRYAPLVWHVRQQTGLEIVRLHGPFAVNQHPAEGAYFDMSLFYLAVATGEQTGGKLLAAGTLPSFSSDCPAESDFIRNFLATGNPLRNKPTFWERLTRCWR
jgi:hypothetical protein